MFCHPSCGMMLYTVFTLDIDLRFEHSYDIMAVSHRDQIYLQTWIVVVISSIYNFIYGEIGKYHTNKTSGVARWADLLVVKVCSVTNTCILNLPIHL